MSKVEKLKQKIINEQSISYEEAENVLLKKTHTTLALSNTLINEALEHEEK